MRHSYQGTFKDINGAVVGSLTTSDGNAGTITVYLADGTTAADVYAASSGGAAVNFVQTDDYGHQQERPDFFDFQIKVYKCAKPSQMRI